MSELEYDPIRDFLRQQGQPYAIIANGLQGLVENWERVVRLVVTGYPHSLDDYLNDIDCRQLLENALELAPVDVRAMLTARITEADRMIRPALTQAARCLWGGIAADNEGWTAEKNWWYFSVPTSPGPRLAQELTDM
jgi:hypothetical protein